MSKFGLAAATTAATMTIALASTGGANAQSKFQCEPGETYVMNVMVSAHPYWVPVYQGFKQAAEAMGCETVFSGTPDYDITKQIASFEHGVDERLLPRPERVVTEVAMQRGADIHGGVTGKHAGPADDDGSVVRGRRKRLAFDAA